VPEDRTGGYVTTAARRKTISVYIQGPYNMMTLIPSEGGPIPVNTLGFQNGNEVLPAKRAFSDRLYQLSRTLDDQIVRSKVNLEELTGKAYEEAVRTLLTLPDGDRELALYDLKKIGLGLRQQLHPDLAAALASLGVMKQPLQDEPEITFINFNQVPVLWDMLYEEEQPFEKTDWQHFWGFKLPLTHWDAAKHPPNRLKLKRGLFSVIDQKLSFAASEVLLLEQILTGGLCHRSLCDELKAKARDALRNEIAETPEEWLAEHGPESWLREFIENLNKDIKDRNLITVNTREWKDRAINAIFSDQSFTYELIHFACHCEPDEVSELLSELKIHIAGEEISLTVASMPAARRSDQPGPLVFLNACGTGQQGPSAEPPGFPNDWISKREAIAVVATLCPVPDLFAHAFARKFYETLFCLRKDPQAKEAPPVPQAPVVERYLAQALLETRRYFMEKCGNPLGLAYVLYAVKDACVESQN